MDMIIRERETMNVKPCSCGAYPKFVYLNFGWTDTWLQCPMCGKKTSNTGGYHYAMEIPIEEAKRDAVIEWNKMED